MKNKYKPTDSGLLKQGLGLTMGKIKNSVKLEVHFDPESSFY